MQEVPSAQLGRSKTQARLPRRVKTALTDFQRQVLELFPGEIRQIILYGSYARGEAAPDSDVDVMVVVGWSDPTQPNGYYLGGASDSRWRQIIDAAVEAMIVHGPSISALVVGERLFNSNWSVARAAKEEGRILWNSQPT